MLENQISLSIEENVIRIVKAGSSGGKIAIDFLARQEDMPAFYQSDTKKVFDDTAELLKKLIDSLKLHKKKLNIVIPDGFTYSQVVYMPRLKEKELLSAIRYQADQFIPMPIDETSLDLEIIYEDKTTNKLLVLIVAAPQNLIARIQRLSEVVGFYPATIENELSTTARFLANFYTPPSPDGGTIFMNLGYSYTSFYFLDHKLKLLTDSHNFPVGFSVFLREAQADINIDRLKAKSLLKEVGFSQNSSVDLNQILQPAADALCSELKRYVSSVQTKFQITSINRLLMFNLATEINHLAKKIETCVSIPTAIFDPTPITIRTPVIEPFIKDLPSFVTAIGGCLT